MIFRRPMLGLPGRSRLCKAVVLPLRLQAGNGHGSPTERVCSVDLWQNKRNFQKYSLEIIHLARKVSGGRYWDRTSGFHRVKVALYR